MCWLLNFGCERAFKSVLSTFWCISRCCGPGNSLYPLLSQVPTDLSAQRAELEDATQRAEKSQAEQLASLKQDQAWQVAAAEGALSRRVHAKEVAAHEAAEQDATVRERLQAQRDAARAATERPRFLRAAFFFVGMVKVGLP